MRAPAVMLVASMLGCGPPAVPPASSAARARVHVTMYTTRWCRVCAMARSWLQRRGIPYDERDVELDMAAAAQHRRLDPDRTVPVIVIDRGGIMIGFVPSELRRRIDRAAHVRCESQPLRRGCD